MKGAVDMHAWQGNLIKKLRTTGSNKISFLQIKLKTIQSLCYP